MSDSHDTARTQFIEASGVSYAYRRFGSGKRRPLICLQHFRGGLDHWDPLITDGLAQDGSVILFNNAGVASSGGKPANSISGMAKYVIVFAEALGLDNFDLLGFSLGGFVAQQVSIDRPRLVHRLILAGTGPEGGECMGGYPASITERATREVPIEDDFLHLFFSPTSTSQAAGRDFWKRRHARKDQDVPSSPAAMVAQAEAISDWGVIPNQNRYVQLNRIEQPTLIVNGKHDVMVPTINSYILQQQLPKATLIIYPDSGHGAIFQFPQLFVRHATLFLRGDQTGGA